jgi:hypothetical protein
VLSATSLSPCEMVGSTTSAEACYAEISSKFKSKCKSCGAEPVCAVCDFAVSL